MSKEVFPSGAPENKKEQILRETLPFIREAYERAEMMIREAAIDPRNFVYPYGVDTVKKDIVWTEKMLRQHEEAFDANKMLATIIEAIMYEHIEQSNWLGENTRTIKTSFFDDIRNGVDLIAEFEDGRDSFTHMGLAIDVTFGNTASQNKILEIRKNIEQGKLAEIKYFESERSPYKGLYQNLPRVVVGADRNHISDLIRLWSDKTRKKDMPEHPIHGMIIHEILDQLTCFEQYAAQCGQKMLAETLGKQRAIMQKIIKQKQGNFFENYEAADGVYGGIKHQLELF